MELLITLKSIDLHRGFGLERKRMQSFKRVKLIAFILLTIATVFINLSSQGQGNLLLTPRRVVLDANKKTMDISVANSGKDSARYMISLVELRMKEDGTLEPITEPDSGQQFASKYLRIFPRTVYLGPNEPQVVKVQIKNVGNMEPGEYRSHIYFRAVPDAKPLGETPEPVKPGSISVKLTPLFGITIPVIIHVGKPNVQVDITEASFQMVGDTLPRLNFALVRTGNFSSYGDLFVDYITADGKVANLYTAKGLAVYTPNRIRRTHINLPTDKQVDYHSGTLRISYLKQQDYKDKYAEQVVHLK